MCYGTPYYTSLRYTTLETEFFLKKSDVAKKYNFTSQHIGHILLGKTKKKYIVYDNLVYNIEYEENDKITSSSGYNAQEAQKDIIQSKKLLQI